MGDGQEREGGQHAHTNGNEAVRKRNVAGKDAAAGGGGASKDASDVQGPPWAPGNLDDEMEKTIAELPPWTEQLSFRGFVIGARGRGGADLGRGGPARAWARASMKRARRARRPKAAATIATPAGAVQRLVSHGGQWGAR